MKLYKRLQVVSGKYRRWVFRLYFLYFWYVDFTYKKVSIS